MADCTAPNRGSTIDAVELHCCKFSENAFLFSRTHSFLVRNRDLAKRSGLASLPIQRHLAAGLSNDSSTTSFRFETVLRDVYSSQLSTALPNYLQLCRLNRGSRPNHSFRSFRQYLDTKLAVPKNSYRFIKSSRATSVPGSSGG